MKETVYQELIERLVKERRKLGFSQRELGKKVGIPQSHISKIEKGEVDVQISSLMELARVLGLEVMLIPREYNSLIRALEKGQNPSEVSKYRLEEGDADS
jgi:transcriptional regulator with XRE-family HTH domain